jgi:hypothetical protein
VFGASEVAALDALARSPPHGIGGRRAHRLPLRPAPEHRVTTASVFKVSILGRVLRRAQDEGGSPPRPSTTACG